MSGQHPSPHMQSATPEALGSQQAGAGASSRTVAPPVTQRMGFPMPPRQQPSRQLRRLVGVLGRRGRMLRQLSTLLCPHTVLHRLRAECPSSQVTHWRPQHGARLISRHLQREPRSMPMILEQRPRMRLGCPRRPSGSATGQQRRRLDWRSASSTQRPRSANPSHNPEPRPEANPNPPPDPARPARCELLPSGQAVGHCILSSVSALHTAPHAACTYSGRLSVSVLTEETGNDL